MYHTQRHLERSQVSVDMENHDIVVTSILIGILLLLSTPTADSLPNIAVKGCTITPHSCSCSFTKPSGTCTRSHGDGTCYMGDCNEGFRCDCIGFEHCSIQPCAKFIASGNVTSSTQSTFRCSRQADAGRCIKFSSFLESVDAPRNAKTLSALHLSESVHVETVAARILLSLAKAQNTFQAVLDRLETYTDKISESNRAELEKLGLEIFTDLEKLISDGRRVYEASDAAFNADIQVFYFAHQAIASYKFQVEKHHRLKNELDSLDNHEEICPICDSLEREIEEHDRKRKGDTIMCGSWAQMTRNMYRLATKELAGIQDFERAIAESRLKFEALLTTVLEGI